MISQVSTSLRSLVGKAAHFFARLFFLLARITEPAHSKSFRIGIVGGVGPAATVDLMDKIIQHTPADCDQDHIAMFVEHNPQIPDRTAHLLNGGPDPVPALLSACQRLELNGASIIAIPCNTAHAFIHRIQPKVKTPIISMPGETVAFIAREHPDVNRIGLIATNGTVKSRIYHTALESEKYSIVTPDADHQAMTMEVIYGDAGVKAGFSSGVCLQQFRQVIAHLANNGAQLIILGCTELPLLVPVIAGSSEEPLPMVDPTDILAKSCVNLRPQA
jgi:aspartate racemase